MKYATKVTTRAKSVTRISILYSLELYGTSKIFGSTNIINGNSDASITFAVKLVSSSDPTP